MIPIVNRGMAVVPSEARDGASYVRTAPLFEAPKDGPHAWLNRSLFVGKLGAGSVEAVHIRFFYRVL